MLNPLAFISHQ